MTRLSLGAYLSVSVLIIISGILWVLLTEVDNNYEYPSISPDLNKEQSEIVQRANQSHPEVQQTQKFLSKNMQKSVSGQYNNTTIIEPVNQQIKHSSPLLQENQYNETWGTFPDSNYKPNYYFRNNPWSPDYKPGY